MDRDSLRSLLLDERERLRSVASNLAEDLVLDESQQSSLSELSSYDQHSADIGSETFEREKDISILTTVDAQMEEIDAALARLDDGSYGRCERCGVDIPAERLEAVPTARFCVEHQAELER